MVASCNFLLFFRFQTVREISLGNLSRIVSWPTNKVVPEKPMFLVVAGSRMKSLHFRLVKSKIVTKKKRGTYYMLIVFHTVSFLDFTEVD